MAEWFKPGDIRFWPEHVTWALEHLRELEAGHWPRNPAETGYTDVQGPRRGHGAYFEAPICLAAEITARLGKCNIDGILARQCLADGWDEQTLAELMHTDIYRIRKRVRRVVLYCSGWRRRKVTYSEFARRHGIKLSYQNTTRA